MLHGMSDCANGGRRTACYTVYHLSKNLDLLDNRDIRTRQHDGHLFLIPKIDHYKRCQDPTIRAMKEWNKLSVETRTVQTKNKLVSLLRSDIDNPYQKVLL